MIEQKRDTDELNCSYTSLAHFVLLNKILNRFEFYLFSLRILLALSKKLKERRVGNGALVLASSEVRFSVDSETADPIDVQVVFLFIMYSTS